MNNENEFNGEVISLAIGTEWHDRQATTQVMDYMGAEACKFDDGTWLICIMEDGLDAIYSPRLPAVELEAWCVDNLATFEKIFDENEQDLDSGKVVRVEPWWGQYDEN